MQQKQLMSASLTAADRRVRFSPSGRYFDLGLRKSRYFGGIPRIVTVYPVVVSGSEGDPEWGFCHAAIRVRSRFPLHVFAASGLFGVGRPRGLLTGDRKQRHRHLQGTVANQGPGINTGYGADFPNQQNWTHDQRSVDGVGDWHQHRDQRRQQQHDQQSRHHHDRRPTRPR
jgi:hypothetical protein